MSLLLSFEQQQNIKPISENNAAKYPKLAEEVESLEIDKLLGSAFYQAVSASPDDFKKLLDETEFDRADGTKIKHKGLRYVIAYLNYAKYIGTSDVNDTFSGFVTKSRQDSESLSTGRIKTLQQENREIAFNAFSLIREYIELNLSTYSYWSKTSDRKIRRPNFYSLKNTLK